MAAPGGYSYRPNVNRAITRKWKEASQVSYGGDDWGDDDEEYGYEEPAPVSAGNSRHPGWQDQSHMHPSNRSMNQPSPSRSAGRGSFDRGDDRRNLTGSGAGFESAYPTAQRNPFPDVEPEYEPQPQFPRHPAPLSLHTQGQGPYPPPAFRPSSRGQQQRPYAEGPFSAPGAFPHSRSESGNRSIPPDMYQRPPDAFQRHESPVRPDSRSSNASGRVFPPRKSSLSQAQPPGGFPATSSHASDVTQDAPDESEKAAPALIRPADIYKRIEQEREKERRSQESSRPSLDLNRPKTRDSSTSAQSTTSSDPKQLAATITTEDTDNDGARRLKPTLDTVMERKSEYGFDNMLKDAEPDHPSVQREQSPQSTTSPAFHRQGSFHRQVTNASSVYSDRPDPVSASSVSRNASFGAFPNEEEPTSSKSFRPALPSINRLSSFGTDFRPLTSSAVQNDTAASSVPDNAAPRVPSKDSDRGTLEAPPKGLSHQPSLGYRSVVNQAFEESQNLNPLSPVSGSNTIPRSNSASTADISPVMSRRTEQNSGASGPLVSEPAIPEEHTSPKDRPMSSSTVTPQSAAQQHQPLPPPPAIHAGYRRDVTPPSRDNSPARRPLSAETGGGFRPQHAQVESPPVRSATADVLAADDEDSEIEQPSQSFGPDSVSSHDHDGSIAASPVNARTTSEEYADWRNARKQFNNKFGLQDSNPTTPGLPSPLLRAESPPKGTVKEMREKLESGRSTPANTLAEDRPAPQSRMESFRPSLPGGWQSYTATPGAGTPAREDIDPLKPPRLAANNRHDSTDSIPTAKAPRGWDKSQSGLAGQAFAAAAAAGTALAGAFSGPAMSHNTTDESQGSSDGEWDRSPVSRSPDHHALETRDFAVPQPSNRLAPLSPQEYSKPPTPLAKDTPVGEIAPSTRPVIADAGTPADVEESMPTNDYFPAPLRTSKSTDPTSAVRPPMPNVPAKHESGVSEDNDQLQQEIVKRLTPKSSNFETQPEQLPPSRTSTRSEDGLYGSRSSSPELKPSTGVDPASNNAHQHQPSISTVSTASPQRPLFPHRFSWETEPVTSTMPAQPTPPSAKTPVAQSPDTIRGPSRQVSNVMASPQSTRSATAAVPDASVTSTRSPVVADTGASQDAVPLRKIMNIGNHRARMDAYTRNRDLYAHSDGHLDQWLISMKDTHADLYSSTGRSAVATPTRPSPKRPLTNIGAKKMMPEDGKRIMSAAGRFGGKAGGAAKGLFAKGKEKMRQASAGDKQGLKTTRRKSAGPSLLEPEDPRPSNRSSVLLTAPPQIPAQDLSSSPIDAGDWSLTPNKTIDEDPLRPMQPVSTNDSRSVQPLSAHPIRADRQASEVDYFGLRRGSSPEQPLRTPLQAPLSQRLPSNETSTANATRAAQQDQVQPLISPVDQGPSVHVERETPLTEEPNDGYGQVGSYMPPSQRVSRTVSHVEPDAHPPLPENQFGSEDTPKDAHVGPVQSLTVPEVARTHSIVSDVSSASPSPMKNHDERNLDRSVSPAEEHEPSGERIPSYDAGISRPSKEQEAVADRSAAADPTNHPVPSYDEKDHMGGRPQQARIGPGAHIVPVADLSQHKRMDLNSSAARPFSFDGSEILNQAQQSSSTGGNFEQLRNVPSQPLSPVSQTLSKDMSQVSMEDVAVDQNGSAKRQSRSYSRPFGADPIRDHPALKQSEEAVDRRQMYSTESPLPSARRAQPDVRQPRVQSPPVAEAKEEEEGYRIPGPYRQEYRSPRQSSSPKPQTPSETMNQVLPTQYQQPQRVNSHEQYPEPPHAPIHQPMGRPPAPEASRSRKGGFSGLFRNRSRSRSQRGGQREPDTDQRNMLRRNSRQDSLASQQSSLNEARDVVGQLPSSDKKQRRLSRDLMGKRNSTPPEQGDQRKKRFSLFSRGSKGQSSVPPQRSSTLPHNSVQPDRTRNVPPDQQQMYGEPSRASDQQFQGSQPPAGGYYAPRQEQNRVQDPDVQNYAQGQMQQQYQQRPADLRIDTSNGGRTPQSVPASAPPQTYANRDISYQSRPYVPPNARPNSAEPGDIPRGPSPRVVNLHKRSRSPKLGRQSEDDERTTGEGANSLGTPVGGLGTFSNKKISPVGGIARPDEDQEAPFRIALPGEPGEDKRRTRQLIIEHGSAKERSRPNGSSPTSANSGNAPTQTVAERMTGPQMPAKNITGTATARAPLKQASSSSKGSGHVAELPGSKAEGYESEEEVQMSATAYPGQWQDPIYFDGGRWDD